MVSASLILFNSSNATATANHTDTMGFMVRGSWLILGLFAAGEVLIGFELLHSKFRADLPAIQMWPVSEDAWQRFDAHRPRPFLKCPKRMKTAQGTRPFELGTLNLHAIL